jgi:hypothetical protein
VDTHPAQTASSNFSSSLNNKVRSQLSPSTQNFLQRGVNQQPAQINTETSTQELDLFESALTEVEAQRQLKPVVSPQTPVEPIIQSTQPVQSPPALVLASAGRKEAGPTEVNAVEQAASIQYVEAEKSPELSPEVEKYINEVKEDQDKAPKEIVITDITQDLPADGQYIAEPVIVLPITPEIEKKGKRKSPKFSLRWLVEWSQKIIKIFSGKVIYRDVPAND